MTEQWCAMALSGPRSRDVLARIVDIDVANAAFPFLAVGGTGSSASAISTGQIQLLGIGTTLGIVLQTVALIPFLRRVGFRWRPRYDFRRDEVAEIMRMAAPLFGYILTTQVSFLVVQNVANAAWKVSRKAFCHSRAALDEL